MGGAALEMFATPKHKEHVDLVILDLPTKANREKLLPFEKNHGVQIIWGDLANYGDVLAGVKDAEYVLHAAAVIPPQADHNPDLAYRVNVGAAENIVRAIKAQPDPDTVKLVNIGSVAQTGDRLPPIHVGRVGDPIMPSMFDMYACTKIAAERIVAESGLKHWVSLRQTYILFHETDPVPIMFHMPLNTCFEAISAKDAGRVLVNVTKPGLPENFWRKFYNIGGGIKTRSNYLTFLKATLTANGLNIEDVYERNWFALQNFHCQWFEDSHILHDYLDFQRDGLEEHFKMVEKSNSRSEKILAKLTPNMILKNFIFKPVATNEIDSTMNWIENNPMRTTAFFGSRESFDAIPEWGHDMPEIPAWKDHKRLDHGYDEDKPISDLDMDDMRQAARFRGGECLSEKKDLGLFNKLHWVCAFGHQFEMTANSVLKGGHWCPDCSPPGWNYDEQAKRNPFIAQVWYVHHNSEENNNYPADCIYDLER